ncbi:hypothetical protein NE237_030696 [Protea cynaroides]|uniref:Staygreen protein domain-containing protein n=1 Tax=Protea cynaroides TaxID=273540 RepID=A0A9Q0GUM1_9MAGN|nr:hypothetical protein NE237_030696 [Protea cynaroides]
MGEAIEKYTEFFPRTYILSHCDMTANLTLAISNSTNIDQVCTLITPPFSLMLYNTCKNHNRYAPSSLLSTSCTTHDFVTVKRLESSHPQCPRLNPTFIIPLPPP